ncbi:hypothetical protein CMI37_37165 [Candidatus Pacearchaeota archaeon]|nr:hypothetical protein [Candidatus Pacearchaeota archaeon]|tara:strand:- start:437 stop:766 length:330 start_codon:yes stop_codon:yes gene_type:complete
MVFKSDKQRKAVMAKLKGKGGTRSDVVPRFFVATGIVPTGKLKGKKGRVILGTTSTLKTLKKSSPKVKLNRISKARAKKLIKLGTSRGFIASETERLGKGRIKTIAIGK